MDKERIITRITDRMALTKAPSGLKCRRSRLGERRRATHLRKNALNSLNVVLPSENAIKQKNDVTCGCG